MKQNKLAYRILAFSMASLMFLTSMSFAVDMHFCGDHLVSVNFFGKAKDCHELTQIAAKNDCFSHQELEEQHENCGFETKDCCTNKTLHFEADQDQQNHSISLELTTPFQQFITAYIAVYHNNPIHLQSDNLGFADYRSPFIPRDYSVLFQSFLI